MEFRFRPLEIRDVVLIEAQAADDDRGFFSERFKRSVFEAHGVPGIFVQENHSYSGPRVLRGPSTSRIPLKLLANSWV
jgi:dTDP-4-dehydrorhamnose 3,5-epimerase